MKKYKSKIYLRSVCHLAAFPSSSTVSSLADCSYPAAEFPYPAAEFPYPAAEFPHP